MFSPNLFPVFFGTFTMTNTSGAWTLSLYYLDGEKLREVCRPFPTAGPALETQTSKHVISVEFYSPT